MAKPRKGKARKARRPAVSGDKAALQGMGRTIAKQMKPYYR